MLRAGKADTRHSESTENVVVCASSALDAGRWRGRAREASPWRERHALYPDLRRLPPRPPLDAARPVHRECLAGVEGPHALRRRERSEEHTSELQSQSNLV